jgi:hypothetical protein
MSHILLTTNVVIDDMEVLCMLNQLLLNELKEFIDVETIRVLEDLCASPKFVVESKYDLDSRELDSRFNDEFNDFVNKYRGPTFRQILFSYIDRSGLTDSEIYKRAGIDRRHFSKIRSNPNYQIGKQTIIALSFALRLNEEQCDEFMEAAGYSLSLSDEFDIAVRFFIRKQIFDIDFMNVYLDEINMKLIGNIV